MPRRFCAQCKVYIKVGDKALHCSGECQKWYHLRCKNLTEQDLEYLNEIGKSYECDFLYGKRKLSLNSETPLRRTVSISLEGETVNLVENSELDLNMGEADMKWLKTKVTEILSRLDDFHLIKVKVEELVTSFQYYSEKVETMSEDITTLRAEVKECKQENKTLKHENEELWKEMASFRRKMCEAEQYSYNYNVLIGGIPEKPDENLQEVVEKITTTFGVDCAPTDIDTVHRIGKKTTENKSPRQIVVKFCRHSETTSNVKDNMWTVFLY
ncbi:uncharacterized protein LOC143243317 [Tachypleus tridentatus]|uniref:uncharacterized protein LOC143243317 n=1 Tax=Tachypleus tridentatus TaxID=6853 RepID=UPI003FD53AB5